jgi:colanic acid/amylovoran biosynthesis glycosyltransferase
MLAQGGTPSSRTPLELRGKRLAVIVSRFPKLTETFVLHEVLELKRLGVQVEVLPLRHHREAVVHPELQELVAAAHYRSPFSARLWLDNAYYLSRRPGRYLRTLFRLIKSSWRSPNYLAGVLVFFPKAVSFARLADRVGVQHVHAHFANHPAAVALAMNGLTGCSFSFTARGSDIHVDRTMLEDKVEAAVFAVTVSEYNKQLIVSTCGAASAGKIHVVYGGIDTDLFSPALTDEDGGTFRIVCVGRFEEVKGHSQLLEACGMLAEQEIPFSCHLLGDGELRSKLERQVVRLGLEDRVTFHGNRTQSEIATALRSASVCVLATVPTANGKREGIPNVLKEAMACGVPVLSSRVSGIPELVDDGISGILVAPRDPAALAQALILLAGDSELRARMGRAGRERIERQFDLRSSSRCRAELFFGARSGSQVLTSGSSAGGIAAG